MGWDTLESFCGSCHVNWAWAALCSSGSQGDECSRMVIVVIGAYSFLRLACHWRISTLYAFIRKSTIRQSTVRFEVEILQFRFGCQLGSFGRKVLQLLRLKQLHNGVFLKAGPLQLERSCRVVLGSADRVWLRWTSQSWTCWSWCSHMWPMAFPHWRPWGNWSTSVAMARLQT